MCIISHRQAAQQNQKQTHKFKFEELSLSSVLYTNYRISHSLRTLDHWTFTHNDLSVNSVFGCSVWCKCVEKIPIVIHGIFTDFSSTCHLKLHLPLLLRDSVIWLFYFRAYHSTYCATQETNIEWNANTMANGMQNKADLTIVATQKRKKKREQNNSICRYIASSPISKWPIVKLTHLIMKNLNSVRSLIA